MLRAIFKATLLAGSLDITAACINAYLSRGVSPGYVLQYVASGVFGKEAFNSSYGIMLMGLFFHFIIAFSCAAVFFLLYPKLKFLKYSIVLNSLLIVLVAWAVTTLIIVPLSNVSKGGTFNLARAAISIGILFVCIGLPISILVKRYYEKAIRKL